MNEKTVFGTQEWAQVIMKTVLRVVVMIVNIVTLNLMQSDTNGIR
jgi:hypothetical protein